MSGRGRAAGAAALLGPVGTGRWVEHARASPGKGVGMSLSHIGSLVAAAGASAQSSLTRFADRVGEPGGLWSVVAVAVLAVVIAVMALRAGGAED